MMASLIASRFFMESLPVLLENPVYLWFFRTTRPPATQQLDPRMHIEPMSQWNKVLQYAEYVNVGVRLFEALQ